MSRAGARRSRVAVVVGVFLLLVAALFLTRGGGPTLSHPSPETAPGQLFFDASFPVRLWMPTPAENLELLAPPEALATLLGGVRFGPFAVPPAREASAALDARGGVAAFRFAPWQAMLARWAGRLARNPILAGGRVEGSSRSVSTQWLEDTWILRVDSQWLPPSKAGAAQGFPDALGWVALGEAARRELSLLLKMEVSSAPLELVALDDGWGLRQPDAAWASPFEPPARSELAAARYVRVATDWSLTLLAAPEGVQRPGELRLPSSGARFAREFSPRQLPGGRWLEDLALNPLFSDCGSARCVGWDRQGLLLAESVVAPPSNREGTSIWIWNGALADFLDRFALGLEGLLLVPALDVEAARTMAEWSTALRRWRRTTLYAEPGAFAIRFFDSASIDSEAELP